MEFKIRRAVPNDKDFIVSLVPRLTAFGPPSWRDIENMTAVDTDLLVSRFDEPDDATAIFVAEDVDGGLLGFIHLQPGSDYYNKEPHGHVTDLIVGTEGEGRGVGRALLGKAEVWAREKGYTWLSLSVFGQNTRAKQLYERIGYGEDMIKYIKYLDEPL